MHKSTINCTLKLMVCAVYDHIVYYNLQGILDYR